MTLKDIKIGDKFKFVNYGGLIWVKRTEQGMNKQYSYCETIDKIKNKVRHTTRWRLFDQNKMVVKIK